MARKWKGGFSSHAQKARENIEKQRKADNAKLNNSYIDINSISMSADTYKYYQEALKSRMVFLEYNDFMQLNKLDKIVYINKIKDVMSGKWYNDREKTFVDNYYNGITNVLGDSELADEFDTVYNELSTTNRELMLQELPDLYMFYKDKRANSKRNANITQSQIDEQYDRIIEIVDKYSAIAKQDVLNNDESLE